MWFLGMTTLKNWNHSWDTICFFCLVFKFQICLQMSLLWCFHLQSAVQVSQRGQRLTRGSGCSAAIALRSFQLIPIVQAGGDLLSIRFSRGHGLCGLHDHAYWHMGAGQTHLLLQRCASQVAGVYQTQVTVFQRPRRVKVQGRFLLRKGHIFRFLCCHGFLILKGIWNQDVLHNQFA